MANKKRRSEQHDNSSVPGRPFRKGQSGNPGGRPKIPEDVREATRALTPVAIATLETVCKDQEASPAARVSAAEALLNRAWGRPTQALEVSGPEGGPIPTINPIPKFNTAKEFADWVRTDQARKRPGEAR